MKLGVTAQRRRARDAPRVDHRAAARVPARPARRRSRRRTCAAALEEYPQTLRIVFGTIACLVRARRRVRARCCGARRTSATLAFAQIVCDQLTWTAIVYVSGGATSGATSFYALTCLLGAILVGERGAAVAAAVGAALYAMLVRGVRAPLDPAARRSSRGELRRSSSASSSTRCSSTCSASSWSRSSPATSRCACA